MNIVTYKPLPNEIPFYYGKMTVRKDFGIYNADEEFYALAGNNTCYTVLDLLHPEDAASFQEAASRLEEGPQHLVVRFLVGDFAQKQYRTFYMKLAYSACFIDKEKAIDIELSDMILLTERYKYYRSLIRKYRRILSIHEGLFLEYNYHNHFLQIYEYHNGQSVKLFNKTLEDASNEIKETARLEETQKNEFFALAEAINKGLDCFQLSIDAEVFIPSMKGIRFSCNLALTFEEDCHDKMVGLIQYIGEKKPQKRYYQTDYANDSMTGLFNKRAIHEYAVEQIQNNQRHGYLAIIDIDNFKQINDRFGHMFGDEVIIKTAEILRSITQNRGMAGRFGGDEFLLVLEKVNEEEEVRRIFKVLSKHAKWAFHEKEGFSISFSIGICKFPEDAKTYEEALHIADKCLYIAKEKGKNRYIIYREHLHGAYIHEGVSKRSIGLRAVMSDDKKYELVSELLLKMHRIGRDALGEVMEQMQTYFDIDGIKIYTGADMRCIASRGNYIQHIETMDCVLEPGYQKLFDESGCFLEANMQHLAKNSPLAYEMNKKMECNKFYQFMAKQGDQPVALVSFDFFNRAPKFGVTDQGLMQTVGKFMAEIVK